MVTSQATFAGFWLRVVATVVDTMLLLLVILPVLTAIYGVTYLEHTGLVPLGAWDFIMSWIFPTAVVLAFWVTKGATPGKMVVGARIIDARTGEAPTLRQFVIRYIAYVPALLVLGLGYLWVLVDHRKQGWHDKLAGTVVVKKNRADPRSDV